MSRHGRSPVVDPAFSQFDFHFVSTSFLLKSPSSLGSPEGVTAAEGMSPAVGGAALAYIPETMYGSYETSRVSELSHEEMTSIHFRVSSRPAFFQAWI